MNTKSYLLGGVQKKAGDNGGDTFTIIASTSAVDRQGDVVDQNGWELANFKKNPVLLWAHDYSALPIGKVVSAQVIKGQLIADFVFATADANPVAQQIKRLYEEGIVNASSVGFIPLERQGNVITRSELLELSLVPVPANQEALRRAVEKGFDADFIKTVEAKMEVIDKGAVADELSAEEMAEAKYQNWCKVMDVIQAFGYVYFDQETPVDSFQTLLTETVDLLQQVADGEGTETTTKIGKAIGSAEAKDFTAREEKAGAKLSKNSLAIIGKAMEAMGEGCTHLKSLVDSCAKDEDTQDKSAEEVAEVAVVEEVAPVKPTEAVQDTGSVEADTVVVLSLADVMENVQVMLRANDKTNEAVLSMVNKFVANKKAQAVA